MAAPSTRPDRHDCDCQQFRRRSAPRFGRFEPRRGRHGDTPRRARPRPLRRRGQDRRHLRDRAARTTTRSSRSSTAPGPDEIERAIAGAVRAFEITRQLPSWKREEVLERVADGIDAQREELRAHDRARGGQADQDRARRGRPRRFTFHVAAEETKRIYGEIVPLDWLPGNESRDGAGAPRAARPDRGHLAVQLPAQPRRAQGRAGARRGQSDRHPARVARRRSAALMLAQIVLDAGWPEDGIAVAAVVDGRRARPLVEDDRIKLLTFTGSPGGRLGAEGARRHEAGHARARRQRGGRSSHADADVAYAAERIVWGGFANAGQTCISVQRVLVHDESFDDAFVAELVRRVEDAERRRPARRGHRRRPADRRGGRRARRGVAATRRVAGGARRPHRRRARRRACGGRRCSPASRDDLRVSCEEVFAPVVGLSGFADVGRRDRAAGRSEFGLQAGLFTNDMRVVDEAFDRIEVGGLMVNDVSTFRIDHMPYGGVKHVRPRPRGPALRDRGDDRAEAPDVQPARSASNLA